MKCPNVELDPIDIAEWLEKSKDEEFAEALMLFWQIHWNNDRRPISDYDYLTCDTKGIGKWLTGTLEIIVQKKKDEEKERQTKKRRAEPGYIKFHERKN